MSEEPKTQSADEMSAEVMEKQKQAAKFAMENSFQQGPNDSNDPTILQFTIPIKMLVDDLENGESLIIGHTRLFRQYAVNVLGFLRKKKADGGLIKDVNGVPKGFRGFSGKVAKKLGILH